MNTWRDKTWREKRQRNRGRGFWSKKGNNDASAPTESSLQRKGEWGARKGITEIERMKPQKWAEGKALQWEGQDQRDHHVLWIKRGLRVDLTNGKWCLHFHLSVASLQIWNPPPLLLQTPEKISRWKNLKSGCNMKKRKRWLIQKTDNFLLLWDLT